MRAILRAGFLLGTMLVLHGTSQELEARRQYACSCWGVAEGYLFPLANPLCGSYNIATSFSSPFAVTCYNSCVSWAENAAPASACQGTCGSYEWEGETYYWTPNSWYFDGYWEFNAPYPNYNWGNLTKYGSCG